MNKVQHDYLKAKAAYQAAREAMSPYDEKANAADAAENFGLACDIMEEAYRVTGYHRASKALTKARKALLLYVRDALQGDPHWAAIAPVFETESLFWEDKAADVCVNLNLGDE